MAPPSQVSRRTFLVLTQAAGAGLLLGGYWPESGETARAATPFAPNPFLQIDPDGQVTIWAPRPDMGQGVYTSLPMLVAEELSVDWSTIKIVQAGAGQQYGNQLVGGSGSIRQSFLQLREAGATAKAMLVAAAAKRWGVDPSACHAANGSVEHRASQRCLAYGDLAAAAAMLPVPEDVPLTAPNAFTLLGKATKRLDTPAKVDGSAVFGMDVKVPNMVYAMIARPPAFGGDIESVDDSATTAVPGVKQVIRTPRTELPDYIFLQPTKPGTNYYLPPSVAVIADSTFTAKTGRDALKITWKPAPGVPLTTLALREELKAKVEGTPWRTMHADGDAVEALGKAAKQIEAVYEAPLLAHAAMEPLCATAHVSGDTCEVWAPTQHPQAAQATAAALLGIPVENVTVNVTFLGGGFGRKTPCDFVAQAVVLSKALRVPVKVVWSREDDMQHDLYRQASYHKLAAGLDERNTLVAWHHRLAATPAWTSDLGGPDERVSEIDQPDFPCYTVPNYLVEFTPHHTVVPIGFWRSVEHSYNAFVVQSFIDEVAAAADKNPLALRLELLGDKGAMEGIDYRRWRGVLELAASKGDWGSRLPEGRGRGIAAHYAFGSYVAQVAEVEVADDGSVRVRHIVAAVDCGMVVNPLTVTAQVEGGIVYGLSQTFKHEITLKDGAVEQGNFDDYQVLRINEMPAVDVHIVPSTELPTGIGEPGLPPTAPAVANAIFAVTGRRIRKLPIRPSDLATA